MRKKNVFMLILLLTLTACQPISNEKKAARYYSYNQTGVSTLDMPVCDSLVVIEVPVLSPNMYVLSSEVFDSVFVRKLETKEESIIGEITTVKVNNGMLYVHDKSFIRRIKRFDLSGKYIDDIGSNGSAPGEYIEPTSISFSSTNIFVYDQATRSNILYNYEGEYERSFTTPFKSNFAFILSDSLFLYGGNNNHNYHIQPLQDYSIWISDSTGKVKSYGIKRADEQLMPWGALIPAYEADRNTYLYTDIYTDTLYSVNRLGGVYPYALLKFPFERDCSDITFESARKEESREIRMKHLIVNKCMRVGGYIYIELGLLNEKAYHLIYSINTGKVKMFNTLDYDKTNCSYDFIDVKGVYDDYLIVEIPSFYIVNKYQQKTDYYWEEMDKEFNNNNGARFIDLCKTISPEDNAVLGFFHLGNW